MPPIPVEITCRHCRSGLVEEAATEEQVAVIACALLADALAAGWTERVDGLYCPRCVRELFAPKLDGLKD